MDENHELPIFDSSRGTTFGANCALARVEGGRCHECAVVQSLLHAGCCRWGRHCTDKHSGASLQH
eukprot:2136094-Amphidinium_carterae.1